MSRFKHKVSRLPNLSFTPDTHLYLILLLFFFNFACNFRATLILCRDLLFPHLDDFVYVLFDLMIVTLVDTPSRIPLSQIIQKLLLFCLSIMVV